MMKHLSLVMAFSLIGLADDFIDKAKASLTTDRPVMVYCRSGKRSAAAGKLGRGAALANGESYSEGILSVDAVPGYNTTEDHLQFHPKGRDNGYVLPKVLIPYHYGQTDISSVPALLPGIDVRIRQMQ